jgi:hypothetical protein
MPSIDPQKFHRQALKVLGKLEGTVARQLKPLINRQYQDAASAFLKGAWNEAIIDEQENRLRSILKTHYKRTANAAEMVVESIFIPLLGKGLGESYWAEIERFTRVHTAQKVIGIQETTRKAINRVIDVGIREGKTGAEISRDLRVTGGIDSRFRANRIARTETHSLYNSATNTAIDQTGYKFERVWSTTIDMRTRRRKKGSLWDHISANGQRRDQETPFDVSGENLMFPGDPNGSAGNVINCRCVLLYEPVRLGYQPAKPVAPIDPVTAIPRVLQAGTLEEAQQIADDQGINVTFSDQFSDAENLEYFNNHTKAISELRKAGFTDPNFGKKLTIDPDPFDDGILAVAGRDQKGNYGYTIYPRNFKKQTTKTQFKENIADISKEDPPIGMFTNNYEVAVHELGHNMEHLLPSRLRKEWHDYYLGDGQLIGGDSPQAPSFYAQESPGELFAESILSFMKGKKTGSTRKAIELLKQAGMYDN